MSQQDTRYNISAVRDLLAQVAVSDTVTFAGGVLISDDDTGVWACVIGGNVLPVVWLDSANPYDGQQCMVAVVNPAGGQSYAIMLGAVSASPNQGELGEVKTVGALSCTVLVNGLTVTAQRVSSYTPVVTDTAFLIWRTGIPYALCAITLTAPAAPPVTKPPPPIVKPKPAAVPPKAPPPKATGTNNYSCTSSGTWTTGYSWNSYFGAKVYSGSGYVPASRGTWFYNGATKSLASRPNITRVQFYLGARQQAGSYNSTVTVHFYVSSDKNKGGMPNTITSVYNVNVAPGWGGGWISLPTSFGTALKAGGSITIAGDPYVGFMAGPGQPASGALKISWRM